MAIKRSSTVNAEFSMSSLTDIIFLLLIFFMLTSTFVSTSGVTVDLPPSKGPQVIHQTVTVTVTNELVYFVNDTEVSFGQLEGTIYENLTGDYEDGIILRADANIDYIEFVKVLKICNKLADKVVIATRPETI